MIARTAPAWHTETWQQALARAIRDPEELLRRLNLPMTLLEGAQQAALQFPLRVTEAYLSRIEPGNPDDPLLKQVLPLLEECKNTAGFVSDPVGDMQARRSTSLLQKYAHRALLITTPACAIHCRYCFRRHYPYQTGDETAHPWQDAIAQISRDDSIEELILSGGDPLSLSTKRLHQLSDMLRPIPHLKRLRLHTRLPIVLPERVNQPLLDWLSELPWPVVMVVHCNHPQEIDQNVRNGLHQLRRLGVHLLNQAVLLRGVNDSTSIQITLNRQLFDSGVLPYYLHLLDKVRGAAHFDIDEDIARSIYEEIQSILPGYLVPRLVREIEGDTHKRLICPN